jgi:hypothetical protein
VKIRDLVIDETQILSEPAPWEGTRVIAGLMARDANDATSAKIGITFVERGTGKDRKVVLGPRGAAAVPVEHGHQGVPPKRPVKRTIDRYRVG